MGPVETRRAQDQRSLIEPLDPGPGLAGEDFVELVANDGIAGGRIYDAHIAEIAVQARARTVITDNKRHFLHLEQNGIRILGSAEACAAL